MAQPKVIVNLYPVLPARDEAERRPAVRSDATLRSITKSFTT